MKRMLACVLALSAWCVGAAEISERLEVALPSDWVLAAYRGEGDIKITEWVPPGQSAEAWTEMISLQVHEAPQDLSPRPYAERLIRNSRSTLRAPSVTTTPMEWLDGVAVMDLHISGRESAERPHLEIRARLLRGETRLFVVQWIRQGDGPAREKTEQKHFFERVSVRKTASTLPTPESNSAGGPEGVFRAG